MTQEKVPINGAILRWAREIAGLTLEDAAKRAKISAPRKVKGQEPMTAADRLQAWEEGRELPSYAQIKSMAKFFRRPLVTFFLSAPPKQANIFVDYRVVSHHPVDSIEFAALKQRVIALYRELAGIAEDENADILSFVNSVSEDAGVANIVSSINTILKLDAGWQAKKKKFKYLRNKAQDIGIFVILMGDLGSYHSRVAVDEFRGMAVADQYAPLIVINSNDAETARLFTLAHELTHIWLGNSGISNMDSADSTPGNDKTEKFCNAVAAELLVPRDMLVSLWQKSSGDVLERIKTVANKFSVSEQALAIRLADVQLIGQETFRQAMALYGARLNRIKQQNKTSTGGPSANTSLKYNLGTKVINTFTRAIDNGLISLLDAARTLDIAVSRFEKVAG